MKARKKLDILAYAIHVIIYKLFFSFDALSASSFFKFKVYLFMEREIME